MSPLLPILGAAIVIVIALWFFFLREKHPGHRG